MHVRQMREREDFNTIFARTLEKGWSAQYGIEAQLSFSRGVVGQHWRYHSLFGAFFVADLGSRGRRFIRDSFRYTPVRWRLPLQWAVGTALGTARGLRVSSSRGFVLSPGFANGRDLVVVPGNQRVRVFDFGAGCVRAFLKSGFQAHTMRIEVETRTSPTAPPALPVSAWASDFSWFDEPILDAYALPRCPPWRPRQSYLASALSQLERWARPAYTEQDVANYVGELSEQLSQGIVQLSEAHRKFPAPRLRDQIERLAAVAMSLGSVTLSPSHGDFQPGNILVGRHDEQVTVIDWEHCGIRTQYYDRMVLGLHTRSANGLSERVEAFLAPSSVPNAMLALAALPKNLAWRRAYAAVFFLEDVLWFVRESTTGPFTQPSYGLILYIEELERIIPLLETKAPA